MRIALVCQSLLPMAELLKVEARVKLFKLWSQVNMTNCDIRSDCNWCITSLDWADVFSSGGRFLVPRTHLFHAFHRL